MRKLHAAAVSLSHATIGRVCEHMMGREHTRAHRTAVGVGVMACGVLIAKSAALFAFEPVHVILDGLGYMIHAAGATPLLEFAFAPFAAPAEEALEEGADA